MSANLGSTTYTSIAWTSGDTITEAKLDSMVANDQAYNSHAAEGILLNNNKSFASKNAAASANLNLIKLDASDNIQVGENDQAGHTVLNAGSNKVTKFKSVRQDNEVDTYTENTAEVYGWGYKLSIASQEDSKVVTFPFTFQDVPIVIVSSPGGKNTLPASVGDFDQQAQNYKVSKLNATTTGFTVFCASLSQDGGSAPNLNTVNTYWGFEFIAKGRYA